MKLRIGVTLSLITVIGGWIGSYATSQSLRRSTPFVAEIEKRFKKSPDEKNPSILRITYARRSDDSFVQIFDSKSPDGSQTERMTEIFDAQKLQHIVLEPFTKSAVTMQYSAREYQQTVSSLETENCGPQTSKDAKDASSAADGTSQMRFGRKAMHEVERIPLAAPNDNVQEWRHERYTVPELRCFSMHTIDRRSDGSTTEEEVVSFQEGEPPPSYFNVPSEYEERSPRELNQAYAKKFGQEHQFWGDAAVKGIERRYQRMKANSRP